MLVLCKVLAAVVVPLLAPLAAAQAYPDKPIRVILSVPAGGTPDLMIRMLAPGLSSLLGQQLVIDNRGGAGGLIAVELALRAAPDGYTLFLSGPSVTILPHVQKKAGYDPRNDFVPISQVTMGPYLLTTHPSAPFTTIKELIGFAKAQPGKLNYGSSGSGQPSHLAIELLKSMVGVNITHVPYKGLQQAVTDLVGKRVDLTLFSILTVLPHIKAGRLRLLAISSAKRFPLMPDVPTISEAGVPGFEFGTWHGLLAPAKTPSPIITRLNDALVKAVRTPAITSQFGAQGLAPVGSSPEEFDVFIRREYEKNGKLVKLTGARVD